MSSRSSHQMAEQRREPRFTCSVPARLWVTGELSVFGRAVDVSLHGMCILRSNLAPSDVVGLGQVPHDQLDRADAVVVAGNRQIDQVGIAIGVDQRYGRHAQRAGLLDRVLLLVRIDDHQALGHAVQRADAVEVAEHLAIFASQRRLSFLRVGRNLIAAADFFDLFQATKPAADRAEICQAAAQPDKVPPCRANCASYIREQCTTS